jgi:hypothetical protein
MTAIIIILVIFALMIFIPLCLCWAAKDSRDAECERIISKEKIYCEGREK